MLSHAGDCPLGDDPKTPGVLEVQTVLCNAATGRNPLAEFTFSFRQQTSPGILVTASAADVKYVAFALVPPYTTMIYTWMGGGLLLATHAVRAVCSSHQPVSHVLHATMCTVLRCPPLAPQGAVGSHVYH